MDNIFDILIISLLLIPLLITYIILERNDKRE